MIKKNRRHKPLYKKFLRLKINPWANNKFLKVKMQLKTERYDKQRKLLKKPRIKKESLQIERFKKEKWVKFLEFLKKTNKFYRKFKPYKLYSYGTSKFASQGNSFKKRFRNELIAKKTFNYQYGVLSRKYLKDRITKIYNSENSRNPMRVSIEFFESRLDSVLYRSKFSHSVKSARQLIAHKHVKVNNRTEQNKSYILKQGDLIEINSKSITIVKANLNKQFKERPDSILWPMPPSYLNINYNTLEIVFGDIKNFDFSMFSTFKTNTDLVIASYYRH
jgi:small subunit ribosomal protein S4